MPTKPKPQMPVKISAVAATLGVSGQTVRTWVRKLGITPCATPLAPLAAPRERPEPKVCRAVWALMPDDAERLIRAYRGR